MTHAVKPRTYLESFVEREGVSFYRIPNFDGMDPFLMSIISDADHWMYVSSAGGLTAGRGNAEAALFPYETDDRLHKAGGVTGPVTLIRVGDTLWEPLGGRADDGVQRNIYKSVLGNQLVFEEINENLGLAFSYRWANSRRFGFVRTATLANLGESAHEVQIMDGLLNILPHGLEPATYQSMSNLTHAYRRTELVDDAVRLAVFSLEALISDRAEPAESLRANVVWSTGLEDARVALDDAAIAAFRLGNDIEDATVVTGRPGAYLIRSRAVLDPGSSSRWAIVADVGKSQSEVAELPPTVSSAGMPSQLEESIRRGSLALHDLLADADAQQCTGERMADVHHLANVAFNSMRGGVFVTATEVGREAFIRHLARRNEPVARRHDSALRSLPAVVDRDVLLSHAVASGDPQLVRLTIGYLPLTFSRRHGDPSRPWNAFSIKLRDDAGNPIVWYEGNWRDIFQNWEALALSYPAYLPAMVSVFLNASTRDGFNPYRINSDGIDWEVPEPDNPWSNIGYWGDHQIVYLQRLLAMAARFDPAGLDDMLEERWFSYADVPYRIAPYVDVVRDPHATIAFDDDAHEVIAQRVGRVGQDGKLVSDPDGEVFLVSMVEKLLVPVLAKLSNLVPGGGIWMNTQRPEWNDANNALVGNGLSMVTACYLRRHIDELATLFARAELESVEVSAELSDWMDAIAETFESNLDYVGSELSDTKRRSVTDGLGLAFSEYRRRVYGSELAGWSEVRLDAVVELLKTALRHLDDTIVRNERSDGLYHSYNLAHFGDDVTKVERLEAMLEGQVAVLSSGLLDAAGKVAVLEALFASDLYREDQKSFILYPVRRLPGFLEKNIIPAEVARNSDLIGALVEAGESSVVEADDFGAIRFSPECVNARALSSLLDRLAEDERWAELVARDAGAIQNAYEAVFRHHAYTGRSGSMYGYEGIGSIYWHMVAKLLVAVQESIVEAADSGESDALVDRLCEFYWRVRAGLGFEKTAAEFGAFPMDPYSHTPAHAGAQQPGMTGQVKEEILTRPMELGLRIRSGSIEFDPVLLRRRVLLANSAQWVYQDEERSQTLDLPADAVGLSLCRVPITVALTSGDASVRAVLADGTSRHSPGLVLDRDTSQQVFARRGGVARIDALVPQHLLRSGHES